MSIRITGEDRIRLVVEAAVQLYRAMPEERSTSIPSRTAQAMRATSAVDIAFQILEDATKRVNGV